jgi:predicted nucleic acid-binding protein
VIVVSNSSPLISLAKIDRFNLLEQLYGGLTISSDVHREVVLAGPQLPGAVETSQSAWIQVRQVKEPGDLAAAQQRFGLGVGELSALILSREIGANLLLLDDLGARKLALREGFRVQGTIGVLEACFKKGYLLELRGAYELLLKRGVYLNRALLNVSLESCGFVPL